MIAAARVIAVTLLVAFTATPAAATRAAQASGARVEGTVTDRWGSAVSGASVTVTSADGTARGVTDAAGRYSVVATGGGTARIEIGAEGFSAVERTVALATEGAVTVDAVLDPAPFAEEVTVTPNRVETRTGASGASVVTLSDRDVAVTAAVSIDGILRQVAGFTLFRRADSRVANPTTQGASLRGIAPSGASRVAVFADGLPLNDPFGGWVYWSRVPREAVRRVEVVRGGGSSLYGTDALGGVVNILTGPPGDRPSLSVEGSGGTLGTGLASLSASGALGGWRGVAALEAFRTEGYGVVNGDERGAVDTAAGSDHRTIDLAVERAFSAGRVFARGLLFDEDRENGTPLQTNDTYFRQLAAGADWASPGAGRLAARAYASTQVYDQTFSAVAEDRETEALTRAQRVPAQQVGGSLVWSRPLAERLVVVAGVEGREVRGTSQEVGYFAGRATSALEAGGRQRAFGLFGDAVLEAGDVVTLSGGLRYDRWRNYEGRSVSWPLADLAGVVVRNFDERTESAFSPRVALVVRVVPRVALRAAAYRAFRAPTLNELYRGFRVGDVLTLANDQLRAERLTGGEVGASAALLDERLAIRGTAYWAEVTRPVANVTLEVAPELITRRRENLGRTRARGVEIEVEARPWRGATLTGGYVFADSTVLRFEANPALEGLRIPQVPRHQGTIQAALALPAAVLVGAQARFVGEQYDDDRNQLELAAFGTLDVVVSRPLGRGVEVFVAGENVTGDRYEVGRTPVTTVGPPASLRLGLRYRSR